ncbi:uncharacterized protein LOC125009965 [Mugil cephalus]|uniref:uncharacterized protein LOC125009965 n=1 Tax=Mugil cephalus TaxID=48193 RepID=UPI001FB606F9|nr:uncharacterized protein LOC125009965 [Mugil cephalus]
MATKTTNAMDQTTSPREEDPPPTTVDTIRPIVDSFFKWIEPKQWALLLSGNPDDETRYMLAELLTNMMALIVQSTLAEVARTGVKPWEYLSSSLGDALPRAFAQALDVPDEVCRESSHPLTSIIVKEAAAAACVSSMYFVRMYPANPYRKYTTALLTVDEMVDRTIKMLQECTEKKRVMSKHQPLQLKCSPDISTPRHTQEDREDLESIKSDVAERVEEKPAPDRNVSLASRIKTFFKKTVSKMSPLAPTQMPDDTEVTSGEDTASVSAFTFEDNPEEDTRPKEEVFVSSVTKDLISQVFKKSELISATDSLDDIYQSLFNKIRDEVDIKDLNINLNKLKKVDKAILKDLRKTLHCSKEIVGVLMSLKDPYIENLIVSSFKKQLKKHSEEPGTITEFFTALGRTLTYPTYGPTILVF